MNKRALVASGGGSKGSHQIGTIKALLEARGGYDVVCGCSVGALNSAFLAQHNPEDQLRAISELENIWLDLGGDGVIFKNHAPGFLTYLWSLWKGGVRDMSPLQGLIKKKLDHKKLIESKTDLMVGVVSLNSGKYKVVNKYNNSIVDYIWASCVFPILFSPVKIDDEMWVDGGIRHQIPLQDVLRLEDIVEIDIVLTSPQTGHIHDFMLNERFGSILNVATRGAGILSSEIFEKGAVVYVPHDRKIKINLWEPSNEVNKNSFSFDKEEIKQNIERGYRETKEKLERND